MRTGEVAGKQEESGLEGKGDNGAVEVGRKVIRKFDGGHYIYGIPARSRGGGGVSGGGVEMV